MDRPNEIAILSGFPLPPSTNHLYKTIVIRGRSRRAKSKEYKAYEHAVKVWMMTHHHELQLARALTTMAGPGRFIHLDLDFKFHRSRILCKDGKPKRLDTSNRLKALEDALSLILGIDDCWFWSGQYDKSIAPENEVERVEIVMLVAEL